MSMNLKSSFVSHLNSKYPKLTKAQLEPLISDQLISPFQISLSVDQIETIKTEINSYWNLREWGKRNLTDKFNELGLKTPANYAVCMSYDFHINSEGNPELIEINTNAAFLALGLELYSFFNLNNCASTFSESSLIEMFKKEILLSSNSNSIAIIDETPELQRLYSEFLVFKELFNKYDIQSEIIDRKEVEKLKNFGLIYNRYTDFFLQDNSSQDLKKLYNANLNFSPNPYEYYLLADKQRLIDWNIQTEVSKPSSLLPVYDLGLSEREKIWSERKNLFIKPKNSYGSKQAYRAGSMSRKMFDEVYGSDFIAQKFSTPSEIEVDINGKNEKFKYDLRCYAYKNELQLIIARLYQGQTTNLKTIGGGFAAVKKSI